MKSRHQSVEFLEHFVVLSVPVFVLVCLSATILVSNTKDIGHS